MGAAPLSIYLAQEGSGLGTALYQELLGRLDGCPAVHRAVAGIALPNEPSVALHRRAGFRQVGVFNEMGHKFGRWWDVAWFERPVPLE